MNKAHPVWKWRAGSVDETKEHIELSYGDARETHYESWEPIARIGKPKKQTFIVEWLIQEDSSEHHKILTEAREELDFYLIENNGPNPWGYAIYHCNTGANIYSDVHWSYFQEGKQGERYASEVMELPAKENKKLRRDSRESRKYIIKRGIEPCQEETNEDDETEITKAIFIRHNMSSTQKILEELWKNRQIAIHYQDIKSINPDDYKRKVAQQAIRRLNEYCDTGVIVGAVCRKIRKSEMLVGIIPKGSKIIPTRYGNRYIYKTVQLQNVKEISLADYPLLDAIQPIKTTISEWKGATELLCSIAYGKPILPKLEFLSPKQLEVVCQEYLRIKGILKVLLLPVGGSLQDIDIIGIGEDGNKVLAQVTHSKQTGKVGSKLQRLKQFRGQENKLIFFGPKSCNTPDSEVEYIPIETVFSELYSKQKGIYRRAIELMFGK